MLPNTKAGNTMNAKSFAITNKISFTVAPLIFRMAISLRRRKISSSTYPIKPSRVINSMMTEAIIMELRNKRALLYSLTHSLLNDRNSRLSSSVNENNFAFNSFSKAWEGLTTRKMRYVRFPHQISCEAEMGQIITGSVS